VTARGLSEQQVARVRDSFARQSFMATLGAKLCEISCGEVCISYVRRAELLQQHDYLHAGVATAIVDSACGYAALTLAPPRFEILTVEFKANFLRPAAGDRFEARGRVLKPGRVIMVCEGEVWQLADRPVLIAKMSATMIVQER
jgi:uncharacterized protein (TIGR00369 family)